MNTCRDCAECGIETAIKRGKKPVIKFYCKKRSKARKPNDPACMLFRGKD